MALVRTCNVYTLNPCSKPLPYFRRRSRRGACACNRCIDVGEVNKGKLKWHMVLAVVPGPYEPKTLDAYFKRILTTFQKYGPDGTRAARVSPVYTAPVLYAPAPC